MCRKPCFAQHSLENNVINLIKYFMCLCQKILPEEDAFCYNAIGKNFFYIFRLFLVRFSHFARRLGQTKFTHLSFSITNLHFSITNLSFSCRLQRLRRNFALNLIKKWNEICSDRESNPGWLDHKQLSFPMSYQGFDISQVDLLHLILPVEFFLDFSMILVDFLHRELAFWGSNGTRHLWAWPALWAWQ